MAKKSQTREERLAAALRANLKRRKEAARASGRPPETPAPPKTTARPNAAKKSD